MKIVNLLKKAVVMGIVIGTLSAGMITQAYDPVIKVVVNGAEVFFSDGWPFADKSGRILVPVRFVSEQLGATVGWNKEEKIVTVKDGDKIVTLIVGQKEIIINGTTKQLDTCATSKSGRTYVPLRFVSEALEAQVKWDGKARVVYVNNGRDPIPQAKVLKAGPFTVPVTANGNLTDNDNNWNYETETHLGIYLLKPGADERLIGTFILAYGFGPYDVHCDEVGAILRQAISQNKVNEIVNYAKTKTSMFVNIQEKTFYEGKYEIIVEDGKEGGRTVNIRILYK